MMHSQAAASMCMRDRVRQIEHTAGRGSCVACWRSDRRLCETDRIGPLRAPRPRACASRASGCLGPLRVCCARLCLSESPSRSASKLLPPHCTLPAAALARTACHRSQHSPSGSGRAPHQIYFFTPSHPSRRALQILYNAIAQPTHERQHIFRADTRARPTRNMALSMRAATPRAYG